MSISRDDFQKRAKLVCDHWYFKYDTGGVLLLMEKPYVKAPGWETDYVVLSYPKDKTFTEDTLNHLKKIHQLRLRGQQKQVMEEMTGRNKMREEASKKKFHAANKSLFKDALGIFKKQAQEMGITASSLKTSMKNVGYDDTQKVINKTYDYAERVANDKAKAMHPGDAFEVLRRSRVMGD